MALVKTIREKFEAPEDARFWAHILAMAPFMFQGARALKNMGVLSALAKKVGTSSKSEIAKELKVSDYALELLLDVGESSGLVGLNDHGYYLTTAGKFFLEDPMVEVNSNFTADVCYEGLAHLEESLKTGKPAGLKVFGSAETIYEGLSKLPPKALKSWFEFDHFFSDDVFPKVLPLILKEGPQSILDVGANTGKFAVACSTYAPEVRLTLLDHSAQLEWAALELRKRNLGKSITFLPMDLLDHKIAFPAGQDAIWMSQFLDCFGKDDILNLMKRAANALSPRGFYYILEPFIDRQKFEPARFCLDMTSLYFTCMANGQSRMYRASDFYELLDQAGLKVVEETRLRISHTLLKCALK